MSLDGVLEWYAAAWPLLAIKCMFIKFILIQEWECMPPAGS